MPYKYLIDKFLHENAVYLDRFWVYLDIDPFTNAY